MRKRNAQAKNRTLLGGAILLTLAAAGCVSEVRSAPALEQATFAGGCFWCMEPPFETRPGVDTVVSGYAGGPEKYPSYKAVAQGKTGHTESVKITFDPRKITYEALLDIFWRNIDPTDAGGQFVDRGAQYRPEIFFHNEAQQKAAEASKAKLTQSGRFKKPIATEITPFSSFYRAEEYHQDFYKKKPGHYKRYRKGSGRDAFLKKIWGAPETKSSNATFQKPQDEFLKKKLSATQYRVTQKDGTEPPFNNAYWKHKAPGIYVDVVSGEPLFSSKDKFDSGTGWPSFTRPLVTENIRRKVDQKFGRERVEIRSVNADSHLGHVFKDGPAPAGLRYCINSAALRFIPVDRLKTAGYASYLAEFQKGDK